MSAKQLAKKTQHTIHQETGLLSTVGLGDNPLLAKFGMDIEAKHTADMFSEWRYEDVPKKLWPISPLSEFWGIGRGYEKRLNDRGIYSMGDLAAYNPYFLKQSLGMLAEQVASRLRKHNVQTKCVHLGIGYSRNSPEGGFSHQRKIEPTNQSKPLVYQVLSLFKEFYVDGCFIRNISVTYSSLVDARAFQFSLFEESEQQLTAYELDTIVDSVRKRFGFPSLVHASSLLEAGTAIDRASLVDGHAGGNDGLHQGGANNEY